MATNRIKLNSPDGNSVIETSNDMEEYYLKMGYSKVIDAVKIPISTFGNKAKPKIKKEENK